MFKVVSKNLACSITVTSRYCLHRANNLCAYKRANKLPKFDMNKLHKRLDELTDYLTPLTSLIDSHMVSFITENLWDKHVPPEIKFEYEKNHSTNIFDLFFQDGCPDENTALQEFKKLAFSMSTTVNDPSIFYNINAFKSHLSELGCSQKNSLQFDKFMCPKKIHEVEVMSDVVAVICDFTGVEHVVDVGDGKGYLSSVLALENKLKVLGIDSSLSNSEGAAKRVEKMKKFWKGVRRKMDNADDVKLSTENVFYKQHTQMVTKDTDLTGIVRGIFEDEGFTNLGLIGLHTCGSLSSTCLAHFAKNKNFKFLANVGCCYHLIENSDFPMSAYLRDRPYSLSRNAKMLSLQPISRIVDSGKVQSDPLMYRAVFEDMLDRVFKMEGTVKPDVGRISSKCSNFVQYARKACSKLDLPLTMTDSQIEDYFSDLRCHEAKLQFYFLLRLVVSPVIENVILLDRILYLVEHDLLHTYLVQMFDPIVSPRNYGIISFRSE